MGKPAARLGDIASNHGPWPPTPILMGSGTVLINGLPAARKGDMVLLHVIPNNPPHGRAINAGASKVKIDGIPAARVDDAISCGGKVAAGSGNVLIGDSPGKASPTKVNIPDITFPSQSGKIVKGTSPEPISTTPMATIEGQKFTETGHVNDTEVHVEAGHIHAADEELYTVEDGAVATLNYLAEGNNMIEALGSAASLIQNPEALVASLAAAAVSVAALPAGEQGEAAAKALLNGFAEQGVGAKLTESSNLLSTPTKVFPEPPNSFDEVFTRIKIAEDKIAQCRAEIAEGVEGAALPESPYSDDDLLELAKENAGGIKEKYIVRIVATKYARDDRSLGPLQANGKSTYWTTTYTQVEAFDSDAELINQAVGIDHDPKTTYTMFIIDKDKAAEMGDMITFVPIYENMKNLAIDELGVDPYLAETVMTDEYTNIYKGHIQNLKDLNLNPKDEDDLGNYLSLLTENEKSLLTARQTISNELGANEHFLGNGVTKKLQAPTTKEDELQKFDKNRSYGVLESYTLDKSPKLQKELVDSGAIIKVSLR